MSPPAHPFDFGGGVPAHLVGIPTQLPPNYNHFHQMLPPYFNSPQLGHLAQYSYQPERLNIYYFVTEPLTIRLNFTPIEFILLITLHSDDEHTCIST